jgi:hypothetical protein
MTQDVPARAMTQDAPARSKPGEMFAKMHLGLDHVLAKLLLDAPPLPASLTLQTETQSLSTTWVQVTEAFEKRRAMLQRRKEKSKRQAKKAKDKKPKEKESKLKAKQKSRRSSSPRVKTEKKSHKKTASPRVLKLSSDAPVKAEEPGTYEASVLKKLRKQPMCENVTFGSNKYRAIVKWMEVDKGKNAGTSAELMQLLTQLQLGDATQKKKKLSRKRSLESLDDALRSGKRDKRKTGGRRRSEKKKTLYADEDEVVYESGEEDDEPEYDGGYSDSDEAEFVPELSNSPPPEKPKKRATGRSPKRQKQVSQEMKKEASAGMTSKEALAAVVAKIRADDVASGKSDPKYLSYEKPKAAEPGASPTSAIVLDDSDEEDEEEEEASSEEEETKDAHEHDSSTDDDNGLFDLNEEDVYVVEAILCVKEGRTLLSAGGQKNKDADLYLVKWDGYNELTWEPQENIPQLLIDMFRERERAKRKCQYQIKVAHERREVINVTTQTREIIYLIQWGNQDAAVWEPRVTLPPKTQVWLDKVLGGGPVVSKKRRETKAAKQFFYQ